MSDDSQAVNFNKYSYKYPGSKDALALRDISLSVDKGDFLLLAGPSGGGKSTLAKAACCFLRNGKTKGSINLLGRSLNNATAMDVVGDIGYVQQDPSSQIVCEQVQEEVAFGLENMGVDPQNIRQRISHALEVVEGSNLLNRSTDTMSGGEMQKVAMASILAMEPSILVLDEPTASLDPSSTRSVIKAAFALKKKKGLTLLVLEHRLDAFMEHASRLAVLRGGEKVLDWHMDDCSNYPPEQLASFGLRVPGYFNVPKPSNNIGHRILGIENITVERGEKRVLDDVSIDIHQGEVVALMGDNGSGKTTLLLSLLNIIKKQEGKVMVNGDDVSGQRTSRIARKIGMVFQNPIHQIFERTIHEEVAFAPKNFCLDNPEEMAKDVLQRYSMYEMKMRPPQDMSHGQKRRLNMASVEVYCPSILLLDEPFIGQDMDNTRRICAHISQATAKGAGVLMVSHDPDMVENFCTRLVFMDDGRIAVDAPVEEAFQSLKSMGHSEYTPGGWRY